MTSSMTSFLPTVRVLGRATAPAAERALAGPGAAVRDRWSVGAAAPDAEVLVEVLKANHRMVLHAHFYGNRAVGRVVLPSGRYMTAADVAAVRGRTLRNLRLLLCQPSGAALPRLVERWGPTGVTVHVPVASAQFAALAPGQLVHLVPDVPGDARYRAADERERLDAANGVTAGAGAAPRADAGQRPPLVPSGARRAPDPARGGDPALPRGGSRGPGRAGPRPPDTARPGTASAALLLLPPFALKAGDDFELVGVGAVRAIEPGTAGRWWVHPLLPQTARGSFSPTGAVTTRWVVSGGSVPQALTISKMSPISAP